ncbi:SDR family NAD(P)-dependent oxidoreductase [Parendozoicomonas haliclonae]|uniref:3-oxoacyl-[acyl-carrier-protein] reductase FabG n=1 Tax=Parendozoicomonas haliclonae TaxID=1960125 RepID=A0A1X7AG96_9GAMM|nr:SDR family NAD(P)-dependent oxidoreductase [Parendozoicomonas haliclonae]SMA38229.1 3-oxoacyl-[acyl-carrier-protein] reductase FabG [Parendozoicomonas haliclonae]
MSDKKVVLITGASSGIGRTTAEYLCGKGYRVYGAARRVNDMQEIQRKGGEALFLDITDEENIQSIVSRIMDCEGRIDVLWNNAGFGLYGAIEDVSLDDARRLFETNLFGLSRLSQEVLPHMRKNRSGLIISTSSVSGVISCPLSAWYEATKHALEAWSNSLSMEVSQYNINVSTVVSGFFDTDIWHSARGDVVQRTQSSSYKALYEFVIAQTDKAFSQCKNNKACSTMVMAKMIEKIINDPKPRRTYYTGYMAKRMVLLYKVLGFHLFKAMILSQTNKNSHNDK